MSLMVRPAQGNTARIVNVVHAMGPIIRKD